MKKIIKASLLVTVVVAGLCLSYWAVQPNPKSLVDTAKWLLVSFAIIVAIVAILVKLCGDDDAKG